MQIFVFFCVALNTLVFVHTVSISDYQDSQRQTFKITPLSKLFLPGEEFVNPFCTIRVRFVLLLRCFVTFSRKGKAVTSQIS